MIYVRIPPPIFEVFSGPPTGLTQVIFEAAGRPNINKQPGVKFGKISLNYLDLWHFPPSELRANTCVPMTPCQPQAEDVTFAIMLRPESSHRTRKLLLVGA